MEELTPKPSLRLSSDHRAVGVLSFRDVIGLTLLYVGSSHILQGTKSELLSLILTLTMTVILIPVRMNYRPHIIRDFIVTTILRGRVHGDT